jgi:hypothetical protein
MIEPDRFTWDVDKIATVKKIAIDGGTAGQACAAVGLEPEREHLVYRIAKGQGFRFRNIGRKRDDRALRIVLDEVPAGILSDLARQVGLPRRELAAKLLNIVLLQGPTFLTNLLDEA